MYKRKYGISLIVLVITILILAILASTIIISLSNNNIINKTTETTFKSDIQNIKEAINVLSLEGKLTETTPNYDSVIPDKYKGKIEVLNDGTMLYICNATDKEADLARNMGLVVMDNNGKEINDILKNIQSAANEYVIDNNISEDSNLVL